MILIKTVVKELLAQREGDSGKNEWMPMSVER